MKKFFALAALAAIIPVAAQAQAAAQNNHDTTNWTGFYAGLNIGGENGSSHAQTSAVYSSSSGYFLTTDVQQIAGSGNQNMNPMGYAGGLQFGYNQEISSNWVLGAEADFGALVANDSVTVKTVYSCCSPYFFTIAQKVSTDWMSTIRTRVGHTFAKRGLLFVSGGGAETRLRYSSLFTDNYASAHESASASVLRTGWIAGAGWEYALNRHWSWRAEYLHADFGSVSNAGSVLSTLQGTSTYNYPANPFTHTATLTSNIAHVALNYRF